MSGGDFDVVAGPVDRVMLAAVRGAPVPIPAPYALPAGWQPIDLGPPLAGPLLREHGLPAAWADPHTCRAWYDEYGRARLAVAQWHDGRSATFFAQPAGWTLALHSPERLAA